MLFKSTAQPGHAQQTMPCLLCLVLTDGQIALKTEVSTGKRRELPTLELNM